MKALSVRQPWAWLIVNGHKEVENRTRYIGHFGPLLIHASQTMTKADYEACVLFLQSDPALRPLVSLLPVPEALERGGVVGKVNVLGIARNAGDFVNNRWYTGDVGYFLDDATTLPFAPCKGRLGFFEVAPCL